MTAITNSGGAARKLVTRILAAGAILSVYCVGTLTTSGVVLTASTTSADAQWFGLRGRRGWRGWRGRRGWRGWRGRGRLVCRHRDWSSSRVCWWV